MPGPPSFVRRATGYAVGLVGVVGLLLGGAGAATAATDTGASASAAATTPLATASSPLVVIGIGGVQWSQVGAKATPAIWSMLQHGSTATVTVRSVFSTTCPADGWLSLSAGQRAADPKPLGTHNPPPCRTLTEPVATGGGVIGRSATRQAVTLPRWSAYEGAADSSDFAPVLGLLGDQLATKGVCATAVGPGAAIGLADKTGKVARYVPLGTDLTATVKAVATDCPLTVVDAGDVRGPDNLPTAEVSNGIPEAQQVATIDAHIGEVLAAVPSTATVLLAGLADSGRVPHLRLVAMQGNGFGPGVLYAASTRQPGLIQLTDFTPTILGLVGASVPEDLGGTVLVRQAGSPTSAATRLRDLLDYDRAAQEVHTAVPRFFTGLVLAQLFLYSIAALALRRRGERGRRPILGTVRKVALLFSAVPVATFLANLVPWWRPEHAIVALTLVVAGFSLAIFVLASVGPWRSHPLGDVSVVTVVTLVVLALDVMFGSRLQLSSLMGLQPVVAGRFYGMGNVTYALFATAGLLLAVALADPLVRADRRRLAAVLVVGSGIFVVIVDAWPAWGSDFGGPPASIPAFAFLTFAVLGVRMRIRSAVLIAIGTVATVSLIAYLDYLRPPEKRSHLGKFVETVKEGGAWDVMMRKLHQNIDILTSNILTLLVPIGVLFVILVLYRPSAWGASALQRAFDRSPVLRAGLISGLVIWVIGFALNDSGTAIPAVSATLAIPLVIVTSINALTTGDDVAPAAPATAAPDPPPTA